MVILWSLTTRSLTARIAARLKQWEESQAWLEVTLKLDPQHVYARQALERIKPRESKRGGGWFGWLGGTGRDGED